MKKKILIAGLLIIIAIAGFSVYSNMKKDQERIAQENALLEITNRFNPFVVTNKEALLYENVDGLYTEIGKVKSGYALELSEQPIDLNTTHFKVDALDAYISIHDVDKIESLPENDMRYQRYVVFNENVITQNVTHFYDDNDALVLTLNRPFDLPIIIKDDGRYGVEFDNSLVYVKDIETTHASDNTSIKTRSNIRTFTYHTVYDTETQSCTSVEICHPIEQFEEQLQYLQKENYLTLTMEELELFLDGKIRVPLNTVVLTLDDGIFLENSVPLVEKYEINATFFIITSKVDVHEYMDSKYARFESHTDDMHNNYRCPKNTSYSQGGQMLCEPHDSMIADLKLSQDKLEGSHYFAYPFFDFNDQAKNALREAGFHLAFIGQYTSNGYSDQTTDKMLIRRTTIFGNYPIQMFIDFCTDQD